MLIRLFCSVLFLTVGYVNAQPLPSNVFGESATVDQAGFIYVAGTTQLANLPTTQGVLQQIAPLDCGTLPFEAGRCRHGFVAKVAPSGDSIIWATYLAGDGQDSISGLAVDGTGNIFVAGTTTSKNLLNATTGYSSNPTNLFLAKLSSDGSRLLAGTYFGGSGKDTSGRSIDTVVGPKIDSSGNLYLAGQAASSNFPTTLPDIATSPAAYPGGSFCAHGGEQFLAKFDPSLSKLIYSVRLGSTTWIEGATDFAFGSDGSIYIAGTRGIERLCATWPLVTKVKSDASAAIYSTLVQGSPAAYGAYALAVGRDGSAYISADNRTSGFAPPQGAVWKLDVKGNVAATQQLASRVDSLGVDEHGILGVLGFTEPAGVGGCFTPIANSRALAHNFAQLDASTLALVYQGSFMAAGAWLVTPDQLLLQNPFTTATPFKVIEPGPPAPGTVTCIANSANYAFDAVAPGELVTLFGSQIGPADAAGPMLDADGTVAREIFGTSVRVNGYAAPLLYAGPSQVNLVMPFEIAPNATAHFDLWRDGRLITGFDKNVVALHPAAFTADGSGTQALAILNQDGSVNSSMNPAKLGSVISMFVTGLGAMSPPLADGSLSLLPVSVPQVLPDSIVVGDLPATLEYIGNAPGLVAGVVQINVRIPDDVSSSYLQKGSTYIHVQYGVSVSLAAIDGTFAIQR